MLKLSIEELFLVGNCWVLWRLNQITGNNCLGQTVHGLTRIKYF